MGNDIHNEFKKRMQDAWHNYEPNDEELNIPTPDFSFLEEFDDEPNSMDLDFLDNLKKKHFFSTSRLGKVAVVFIALLVMSSGIAVFLNSNMSYGVKGVFQNIKHYLSPEKEASMDKEGVLSLDVTKWENLEEGKKIVSTLYTPQYIPKGYDFIKCSFVKSEDMATTTYEYFNGEKTLMVTISNVESSPDVYISGERYNPSNSNKDIYVEEVNGEFSATYIKDKLFFHVSSTISTAENVKVIEGIKKSSD